MHKNDQAYQKDQPLEIHGGDRWAAERRWGIKADQFLDFSASINPLGPSPLALQSIKDNLQSLDHYPEPSAQALKRALAEYLQINAEHMVLGNGSMELIYLCGRLFGNRRTIVLAPGFSEYGQGIVQPDVIQIALDLKRLCLPLEEIASILKAGDLLFIANPNNPTGNLFPRQDLLLLMEKVKSKQAVLVLDEAFIDFTGNPNASMRELCDQDQLIILGSLTKFFALPGLRIGYALSSRKNVQTMERLLPRWRINSLALAAGEASVQDHDYIGRTIHLVANESAYLYNELSQINGLRVYPGQANFLLLDASQSGISAGQLQSKLGPEGILIRDCGNFDNLSPYHFRLAVRNHEENLILIKTLKRVLD